MISAPMNNDRSCLVYEKTNIRPLHFMCILIQKSRINNNMHEYVHRKRLLIRDHLCAK